MKKYDFTFTSQGAAPYPKPIRALVVSPDAPDASTGAMLFCHGWGCNRFQHQDKMEVAAEQYNLVCVAPEYRMSGYDYDPLGGAGFFQPYDLSFRQTFDALQSLRMVLETNPALDRTRIFAYGASQGGHIVMLGSIFAPGLFASVMAGSSTCHVPEEDEHLFNLAGRTFAPWELALRDVIGQAERLPERLFLEHGTADPTVPHLLHTVRLEKRLRELGRDPYVRYYEGGGHSLAPTTTRLDTFREMAALTLATDRLAAPDPFSAGTKVELDYGERRLLIDWSRPVGDNDLYQIVKP